MVKASELAGKQLISLLDARAVGYILRLGFSDRLKTVKAAEIASDDDDFPERAFVPLRYLKYDGDVAVIKSAAMLSLSPPVEFVPFPIGAQCFNFRGENLGTLRDIELEGSTVVKLICEKGEFTQKELLSRSDGILVFNDSGKPIRITRKRVPKVGEKQARRTAQILPAHSPAPESVVQTPTSPQSVTVTRTPGEPVKDYSFLLGKPVRQPVTSGGKVIIPAGALVSEETIETARKHGKLVQLALHAY